MDTKENFGNSIQWFPGHMTKTLRLMEKDINNVDAVLVLLDARIVGSSINPEIERIISRKPRLYLLNKADLADPTITEEWIAYLKSSEVGCIALNSLKKKDTQQIRGQIRKELTDLIAKRENKGMSGADISLMVVGIPNVGKSTFINTFIGSARAKAADKPGVTKGKQWLNTDGFHLLDMPGVLWKKFDDKKVAANLAFIGSINDQILDVEEMAAALIEEVASLYPQRLLDRYKLDDRLLTQNGYDILTEIGRKRGMLIKGGEVNTERAAIMIIDEFRACKWGRISLERP